MTLEADGVKVLCVRTDEASPNTKFFKMHQTSDQSVPHKLTIPMRRMGVGFSLSQIHHTLLKQLVIVGHTRVFLALDTWR